jgi:hypothetical protein
MSTDSTNWIIRPWKRMAGLLRLLAILGTILSGAYAFVVRPWHLRWGATDEEASKPLLGDGLVAKAAIESTRAISVYAPEQRVVEEVWSWLEQISPARPQDVRGFYSYTWLDAVSNTPAIADVERSHPEWQHRVVSEVVRLLPATGFKVAALEPNRTKLSIGWGTFAVEPIDESSTRVILRSLVLPRAFVLEHGEGGLHTWLFYHPLLGEFPHFLIERRMLKGIKERAERAQAPKPTKLS